MTISDDFKLVPDHEYGYTIEYLERTLPEDVMHDLNIFMLGQTGALTEDGKLVYYKWDVDPYLKGDKRLWD